MAVKVQIKMLGGFHVFADGVVCDEKICKTKKGSMLLQYLILQRGKSVPCIELYEALWPNDESSNPENALKTLVSRTRSQQGIALLHRHESRLLPLQRHRQLRSGHLRIRGPLR